MKIFVLGGAGAMARVAVRDLLDNDEVEKLCLADLRLDRVMEVSKTLADDRVEPIQADATEPGALAALMKNWDVVINSTWYELNMKVMGAAIAAGTHYLDLGGLYHMTLKQLAMGSAAADAGVACVLGLGSSPGVTNLMATHGAGRMSQVDTVKIRVAGAALKPAPGIFNPPYAFRTILDEACLPAAVLRGGKMVFVPGLSVREEFDLPGPVGRVEGYYTLHSELATLPQNIGKGIREMNFIVAFSPEFSKALSLLVNLGLAAKNELSLPGGRVTPYDVLNRIIDERPRPPESPVDYGIRRVELTGQMDGGASRLVYDCVSGPHERWGIGGRALGTGVPAALGAQWLAGGRVKEAGVFPPEVCIDAEAFLRELNTQGRGIMTYVEDGKGRRLV